MFGSLISALKPALSRMRGTIRRLAGTAEEEPHIAPRAYWDEGVALALFDLVQESETRASGRVQVITLGEFRAAIGELWEKYEDRILLIAESTISRMIGKGATYIPQDKDTWLLLFPGVPEPEAMKRADAIAAKIGEKLVGARFTEVPPPLPEAAKLDLRGALNADGSLNLDRVRAAVESVRQATSLGIGGAKEPLKAPAKPARPTAAPPKMVAVKSDLSAKSEMSQLSVTYRAAWNAETQSLNSFFFRAARADGSEVFAVGSPPPNDATALDLLAAATRAFSEMCEQGLRATLTVPVPYPVLKGPRLSDIQRLISNIPQRERLIHLRLEITHVPQHLGVESLVPLRELFRPYVRDVAVLLDPFQLAEQILALDHIVAGLEIPRGTRRNDEEIFQAMLVFRQRAGRRSTYVLGLASRLQVAHAVTANITEVGGPGVAADLRKLPDQVAVIRRQDLLL